MALTVMRRRIKRKRKLQRRRRMCARLIYVATVFLALGLPIQGNLLLIAGGTHFLRCNRELRTLRHPYSFRDVYPDYRRCNLDSFSDDEYHDFFRFDKAAVKKILNWMTRFENVPHVLFVPYLNRGQHRYYVYSLEEVFLFTLMYMGVPVRQLEVAIRFGRTIPEISRALTFFHELFYDISSSFLQSDNQPWFTERVARRCARALRRKGCPLRNCCGIADGTLRKVCNPGVPWLQTEMYNGHKKSAGLTWVATGLPNGMCLLCLGPSLGRRHDAAAAAQHRLYEKLNNLGSFQGFDAVFSADSAFPTYWPLIPNYGPALTPAQAIWNRDMSRVRISIEWLFGITIQQFAGLDWKQRQKVLASPVHQWYLNGMFLTNLHNINYRNLISQHFKLKPPTFEQYFGVPRGSLD